MSKPSEGVKVIHDIKIREKVQYFEESTNPLMNTSRNPQTLKTIVSQIPHKSNYVQETIASISNGTKRRTKQSTSESLTSPSSSSRVKRIRCFFCHKCGIKFKNFTKLHNHIFQSTKETHLFRCVCCEYILGKTLVNVVLHTETFCSRNEFNNREEALVAASDCKKSYFCERCRRRFETLSCLLKHYEEHSNEVLCCSCCSCTFPNFMELFVHYRNHTVVGNLYLPCKLCSAVFYAPAPAKQHYFTVHSRMFNIPFECELCAQVIFDNEDRFLFHVQGHCRLNRQIKPGRPGIDVSELTCEVCGTIFENVEMCKQHRITVHKVELGMLHTCPQCRKQITLSDIPKHLVDHQKAKFLLLRKRKEETGKNSQEDQEQSKIINEEVSMIQQSIQEKFPLPISLDHKSHLERSQDDLQAHCIVPRINIVPKRKKMVPNLSMPNIVSQKTLSSFSHVLDQVRCDLCNETFSSRFILKEHKKYHSTELTSESPTSSCHDSFTNPCDKDTYFGKFSNSNKYIQTFHKSLEKSDSYIHKSEELIPGSNEFMGTSAEILKEENMFLEWCSFEGEEQGAGQPGSTFRVPNKISEKGHGSSTVVNNARVFSDTECLVPFVLENCPSIVLDETLVESNAMLNSPSTPPPPMWNTEGALPQSKSLRSRSRRRKKKRFFSLFFNQKKSEGNRVSSSSIM